MNPIRPGGLPSEQHTGDGGHHWFAGAVPQAQGAARQDKKHQGSTSSNIMKATRETMAGQASLGIRPIGGKLVPGVRSPAEAAEWLVETPDLANNLPTRWSTGAKEFHLHAQPVKRELLPATP